MSGEVISVLSLVGRYYIVTSERSERGTIIISLRSRVIQLISPSQSCDNLFITYLYLYQALLNRENTVKHRNAFRMRFSLGYF